MSDVFASDHYQQHNKARLEHLASLGLDLNGKTVLELGAGVGDLTPFFLERGCEIVAVDGRAANVAALHGRYPEVSAQVVDLENTDSNAQVFARRYEIGFCYGLLYHLSKPASFLATVCPKVDTLLLETCVSPGQGEDINLCVEDLSIESQSLSGRGCRPTRYWLYHQLQKYFPNVYTCVTQPRHKEFPLNWRGLDSSEGLVRSVFIASADAIDNPLLHRGLVHEHS